MKKSILLAFVLLLGVATVASSAPVALYSADDYPLAGTGQNNRCRAQQFNPISSTPDNGLTGSETFTIAGVNAYVTTGETARLTLSLYLWNTDYNTTVGGTVLAGPTQYDLTTTATWCTVTSGTPLTTNATYLLVWSQSNISGPTGYSMWRSNTNDGGTSNDAWSTLAGCVTPTVVTDREWQIQIDGGSLPVDDWMLY